MRGSIEKKSGAPLSSRASQLIRHRGNQNTTAFNQGKNASETLACYIRQPPPPRDFKRGPTWITPVFCTTNAAPSAAPRRAYAAAGSTLLINCELVSLFIKRGEQQSRREGRVSGQKKKKHGCQQSNDIDFHNLRYYCFMYIIINTSAVSSINVGSILIFASCVIHRPIVSTDRCIITL